MSIFNIEASMERAKRFLGRKERESPRRERSDRGVARLLPEVVEEFRRLAGSQDRPRMAEILAGIGRFCKARELRPPSRAALYRLLDRIPAHAYRLAALPHDVRLTLHNVDPTAPIPGDQIAFRCFHDGNLRALSFAAGMPWLDIHQARRKRGWRPKSRGLLEALCRARGI